MPLSIEAFSTMSPDGITISLSMLLIAYILNIIFKPERVVQKKDIAIIFRHFGYNCIMQNSVCTISGSYIANTNE